MFEHTESRNTRRATFADSPAGRDRRATRRAAIARKAAFIASGLAFEGGE